jgi:hypothetical protein
MLIQFYCSINLLWGIALEEQIYTIKPGKG